MDNSNAQWQYTGSEINNDTVNTTMSAESIKWSASEYISHEKTNGWLVMLLLGSVFVAGLFFLMYRDVLTSLAVLTVGISIGFFGVRQPQPRNYELSPSGLKADSIFHSFSEFKSFSVVEEGAVDSIWLKRLARFKPPVVIYLAPEEEDKIIDLLSNFLPHEQRELDIIDHLSKKIRF